MPDQRTVRRNPTITSHGKQWLHRFGIEEALLKKSVSLLIPHHIDWSERRYHIAGTLGAALARRFFDLAWLTRSPSSCAVRLTPDGQKALQEAFDIHFWLVTHFTESMDACLYNNN
jgi:hypothetical protein